MKDWALILGASSGIGAECARKLAKNGVNIYGLYLRKKRDDIEALKNELSQYNVEVIYKKANASNEDKRLEIIEELKSKGDIRIKMFIHSIAFGTLKKMIGDQNEVLDKRSIDMTLDTMSNNLIYWSQNLFQANLLN